MLNKQTLALPLQSTMHLSESASHKRFDQQYIAHKSAHIPFPFSRLTLHAKLSNLLKSSFIKMPNQKKRQRRTGGQGRVSQEEQEELLG